jgi:drug/metabolite transporter (DMT)-like permease
MVDREYEYCRVPSKVEDEAGQSGANMAIGIILSVGAGMLLAASMNLQQYALTSVNLQESRRYRVWLGGLALYVFAQVICTGAMSFTPLSLVAALFTTMLFWDVLIGKFLLHKPVALSQLVGLSIIFGSVVVVAIFGPKEEYAITTDCLVYWITAETGIVAIVFLALVFVGNYAIYRWFVAAYPQFRDTDPETGTRVPAGVIRDDLHLLMQVVFPALLAVTEAVGSISLKAVSAMALSALAQKDDSQILTVAFFLLAILYGTAVFSIMTWLRIVYAKFSTSECLATEYGELAALSEPLSADSAV